MLLASAHRRAIELAAAEVALASVRAATSEHSRVTAVRFWLFNEQVYAAFRRALG